MQGRESPVAQADATQKTRVLLVEDEVLFARAVYKHLKHAGYDCERAETLARARESARSFFPDLALLDMRLPDGNSMEILEELVTRNVAVVVMTAHGDIADAVQAMKLGATDYLKKPVDLEDLLLAVDKAERTASLKNRLDYSHQRDVHVTEQAEFLGESPAMQHARAQIERLARLMSAAQDARPTVLITGETGTGKDVAARLLHQASVAAERPFVHVDCASLPAELIESELFGHEKGAFTSAQGARPGLIEAAEDGTLFLDEIGELPPALQAKLLSVLERRKVRRLGSTRERPVAAQLVAATNRDLQQMVLDGRFRADLFYRLNVLNLAMPPLRDRGDDVLLLARHFMAQTERRYGLEPHTLAPDACKALRDYSWPGNVRELRHLISRVILTSRVERLRAGDIALPLPGTTPVSGESLAATSTLDGAERVLIEDALRRSGGNVSEAARLLGITRMTIRYRMARHGIQG